MSPETVFAVLLLALLIDTLSVGPQDLQDRLASVMSLTAIHAGFDGSPPDVWLYGQVAALVEQAKLASGDAAFSQADTPMIISVIAGLIALSWIGVMLPPVGMMKKYGGRYASLQFKKKKGKLNAQLWACSILLGLFGDLPAGLVGEIFGGLIGILTPIVGYVPGLVFGVS